MTGAVCRGWRAAPALCRPAEDVLQVSSHPAEPV